MRAPTQTYDLESTHAEETGFTLTLDNFEGPFDLLLSLIARRKLDITEVALAEVTDEFIQYISALYEQGTPGALDTASDFLVTAATLLDLKAARLLPQGTVDHEDDVSLLEARDLLFARLLQYRAYRDVASLLSARYQVESERFARTVALEPQFTKVLPELVFDTGVEEFAAIAARALSTSHFDEEPSTGVQPSLEHLQPPLTTIEKEETYLLDFLTGQDETAQQDFSHLVRGAGDYEIAVVRFLAVLELVRRGQLNVYQDEPLGPITVSLVSIPEEGEEQ